MSQGRTTTEIIERFNRAFVDHDASLLDDLIAEDCVMEAIQPAPDGARTEGREECLTFWRALAEDRSTQFQDEEIVVLGEHATIRWRYRYGSGPADYVRGVNLMRVRDGQIVEAIGYGKTGGEVPLASEQTTEGKPSGEFAVQPVLSTDDIERLSSFYAELFGAEEDLRVPGKKGPFYVVLRFGGAGLGLVSESRKGDAPPGPAIVNVLVDNVDELLPRVKAAGGKLHGKARDMPWGHRVAHISDPDGNTVNLTQVP